MPTIKFEPREILIAIENEVADIVREDALDILTNVTLATPVGNPTLWQNPRSAPAGYVGGHARANWKVSITRPDQSETGGTDKSGAATISKGRGQIAFYKKPTTSLFIQNNVPYINRLNNGWSTQAPKNFVEMALAVVTRNKGRKEI